MLFITAFLLFLFIFVRHISSTNVGGRGGLDFAISLIAAGGVIVKSFVVGRAE